MLHWFAGQKHPEGANDPDATGYIEPPETPAPVFAVRAFKHAIFGTPQTVPPKAARRHSNTERERPKNVELKPPRPGMNGRPKSSNDAHVFLKPEFPPDDEALGSPTKGILLSPGTAAARKKNVTFGENVVDNEEKRPLKSGLPEDSPDAFPGLSVPGSEDTRKRDESPNKGRGRTKLVDALEQVREESRKRKANADRRAKIQDDGNDAVPKELSDPKSESGKYWKREYDMYRMNTQRELKKLITKQRAAKSFAQMKDNQCIELADQLRHEQKKVEKLEAKTSELASLVQDLRNELRMSKGVESAHPKEAASFKSHVRRKDISKPAAIESNALNDHYESKQQRDQEGIESLYDAAERYADDLHSLVERDHDPEDPVQKPSEPYNPSVLSHRSKSDVHRFGTLTKPEPAATQASASDDVWAQSLGSSSPLASRVGDREPTLRTTQQINTSETHTNPLQALDLNTLKTGPSARRGVPSHSTEVEYKSTLGLERVEREHSRREGQKPPHSLQQAPASPILSSAPLLFVKASQTQSLIPSADKASVDNNHAPDQLSSSFHTGVTTSEQQTRPSRLSMVNEFNAAAPHPAKENVPPVPPEHATLPSQSELSARPSAIWSSYNAPPAGQRTTSFTGKDGREVSLDRIEAARARIAARARATSGT